ncbi:MAG: radical SAM protein [Nitrospirae bacterium]|nr:radical SAM protein [Nitrospirota bacterium]
MRSRQKKNKYIFGPVPSRRLGLSLGVDIVPFKTCSFDCTYCQLGRTTEKTITITEHLKTAEMLKELELSLRNGPTPDYITFSGSGEPTLNSRLGEMISAVKKMTSVPVAVLTNAGQLIPSVRDNLYKADLVIPSLDAVTQQTFERVNRPCKGIRIEHIIANLKIFCRYFQGQTWLEIMLVKGINDTQAELTKMAMVLWGINVNKIQLSTVTRPPCEPGALALSRADLEFSKTILGKRAEIIDGLQGRIRKVSSLYREDDIIALLKRRPCTINDIANLMGVHRNELAKYLEEMQRGGKVESLSHASQIYFRSLDDHHCQRLTEYV